MGRSGARGSLIDSGGGERTRLHYWMRAEAFRLENQGADGVTQYRETWALIAENSKAPQAR